MKNVINGFTLVLLFLIGVILAHTHAEIKRVEKLVEPGFSNPIPNSIRVSFGPGLYEMRKTAIISTNEIRISLKEDTRLVVEGAYTPDDGWRTTIQWMRF